MDTSDHTPVNTSAGETAGQPVAAPAPHYLDMHAMMRSDKVALICGDRRLTYGGLNARARRVAHALSKLGVKADDRVAVMSHNSIETLEIAGGLSKLSAIGVQLNYRLREHEVAYILNDCQAKVMIAGPELVEIVDKARAEVPGRVVYVAIGEAAPNGWLGYEDLLATTNEEMTVGAGGLGSGMSYTSGTTGKPKGTYRPRGVPVNDIIQLIQAFELD